MGGARRASTSVRSSRRAASTRPSGGRRSVTTASGRPKRSTPNTRQMNVVRKNKGGQLKISARTQEVAAPEGFHWMQENGRYYLMRGEYKPHAGASRTAKFKLVNHG